MTPLRYIGLVSILLSLTSAFAQYPASPGNTGVQRSPEACPWLNRGTAVRFLGGEVSEVVSVSGALEGTCKFSLKQKPDRRIDVHVSKTTLDGCPAGSSSLRGIGNEALRCKLAATSELRSEMISGRVRDRFFTVELNIGESEGNSATSSSTDPADPLERIAEQLAGNLF